MVGANEKASLDACVGSYEPRCLWLHDANSDGHVNQEDVDIFAESGWTSGDDVPVPPMWRRPVQPQFDVADRGSFDLLDYMQFTMCVGQIGVPTADEFCRMLFDADGDADVDEYDYSLWSTRFTNPADQYEFPSQSRFGNPFMWTGQRFDADVGLYHFFCRSYAGDLGRFKQQDPLGAGALPELCQYSFMVPSSADSGGGCGCSCDRDCGGQGAKRQCSVAMRLSPLSQYSDGLSLFQYVKSRPTHEIDRDGRFTGTLIELQIANAQAFELKAIDYATKMSLGLFAVVLLWDVLEAVDELERVRRIGDITGDPRDKKCLPCQPAKGTKAYEFTRVPPGKPHWPCPDDHTHYFTMHQSPPKSGCQCFWVREKGVECGYVPMGVPVTPAAGGGVAP